MNEEKLIKRVEENVEKPESEKVSLPEITDLPNDFVETAESLRLITGKWSAVEIFTPNVESRTREKTRFFEAYLKDREYNPVFEYDVVENLEIETSRERLKELLSNVRGFKPSNLEQRLARIALYFKIKDGLATTDLVQGLKEKDDELIKKTLKQKYPGTDSELINKANEIYEEMCTFIDEPEKSPAILTQEEQTYLKEKEVDADSIKEAFEWALSQYGMLDSGNGEGYSVVVSEKVTSIDVRDKASEGPTVFINKNRKVTLDKLLALIAHEIEGHARQSVNGKKLFLIGGGNLMGDDDTLYEGLGMRYETSIRERLFGEKESHSNPFYTFAVKDTEDGKSFYEIFSDQVNRRLHTNLKIQPDQKIDHSKLDKKILEISMNKAWETTYRIMRGHIDTSNPQSYANAKDLAYLRGWMLDRDLVKIHAGYLNEAAVIEPDALTLIARFDLRINDLPLPFQDIATKYWEEILKPQMLASN